MNAAQCDISSGSTLFVKVKISSDKRIQYLFENYNLAPLDMYNALWTTWYPKFIVSKPEGRIHKYVNKGLLTISYEIVSLV